MKSQTGREVRVAFNGTRKLDLREVVVCRV